MNASPKYKRANDAWRAVHKPPRAAYIHVPFCLHRCGYCNFTLVAGRDDLIGDYLRAIELELVSRLGTTHPHTNVGEIVGDADLTPTPREVDTLYFGGGTPTHLSPDQFRELTAIVLKWHPLSSGYEWTVEANPADINQATIDTLIELGVTRLSLGGQSFRAEKLRLLERDHAAADIERAVRWAKDGGLQVSLDLIFATPGETLADWKTDLDAAVSLESHHVSIYSLTFEQGTAFWNRKARSELIESDEDLQRDMYATAIDGLTDAGFEHYEVSNFARPGCRSRHNQVYWSGEGYYAAGPGAARYVNGVRETNLRNTTAYIKHVHQGESPVAEREELSEEGRARELLVFGLRRIGGVSRSDFRQRVEFELDEIVGAPLKKFVGLGLLADDGEWVRLTREGLFVSDAMWPEML